MDVQNGLKPIRHKVFKDDAIRNVLHETGYTIVPFLDENQINLLRTLYNNEHILEMQNGGMFYSLYSKDLAYRKRIHEAIANIVSPSFEKYFIDYKNIVNIFITKVSGIESEFYLHQDSTALNEFEHSALSVWIPLQNITENNGALAVVEKSHFLFSPYRAITIKSPFQNIQSTIKEYLKPLYLKAGEAIFFDSRLLHNSLPNLSGEDRLVVLCGIFPKSAKFINCFKDSTENSKIELIEQEDNFILENENFYYDCHAKPKNGNIIAYVDDNFPEMDKETFISFCKKNNVKEEFTVNHLAETNCHFEAEPVKQISKTDTPGNSSQKKLLVKLKSLFFN